MPRRAGAGVLVFLLLAGMSAAGQEDQQKPGQSQGAAPVRPAPEQPPKYIQELDSNAAALGRIPPDPLFAIDPLEPILKPIDVTAQQFIPSSRMAFSATYTFLNQYAAITPDGVRHNQTSGRLDFSGSYIAYNTEGTAGSFSLLIRSGPISVTASNGTSVMLSARESF